jgi:glycosyltransferase involved in cell wall biosynthesis
MSGKEPLVTVGIATYNGAEYLESSLNSVLRSTYSNIELLIVDDGSTDNSVAIAKRVDDPRVRIISKESNSGLVGTRQQIMEESRGTYLAWLDQDDIAYPNRIASQVAVLERNQAIGVCGTWTKRRIHESSGNKSLRKSPSPGGHMEIKASLPFRNPIWFNTATLRISAFRCNNLTFREEYGNTLDYDMWSRAADIMELRNIQKYLGEYRVHPGQTSQGPAAERMLESAWLVQREVLERNLGVKIDANPNHVHRRITLSPSSFLTESDAVEAGSWLRFLAERNRIMGSYHETAFDNVVSRQWLVCLLNVSRGVGVSQALKIAAASRSITGVPTHDLLSYCLSWILRGQGPVIAQKLTQGRS